MKGNGNEIIDVDACSDEIPGEIGRAVDTHPTIRVPNGKTILYVHINIRKKWTFKINYNFIFYIK